MSINQQKIAKSRNIQKFLQSKRIAAATILILLAGCSSPSEGTVVVSNASNAQNQEQTSPSASNITVTENTNESVYADLKLDDIQQIKGVRGQDWLSEKQVIVNRQEANGEPIEFSDGQTLPQGLYIHNIADGKETEIVADNTLWGGAKLSPDKKHLFYLEVFEMTGIGHIMDLETGKSVQIAGGKEILIDGAWLDNEHLVYGNIEGQLFQSDLSGKSQQLLDLADAGKRANGIQAVGDTIYYTGLNEQEVFAYDTSTKNLDRFGKNIEWVIPAPDGSQLALVKRDEQNERTLMLTDLAGNEKKTLTRATQIFGTSWSPDGKRLAYTVTSPTDKGQDGFYISDATTGEAFMISSDLADAGDIMKWSPSGTEIMVNKVSRTGGSYSTEASIITVSW
ncbi:hypothetical protein [Saccharibacillus sp. JS10]|uniref:hypothetical protein n=1 Tax=Saccharibacillus sp. JS10 TaxID=2950552 RepID=UPI00210DA9BD|nr:hypothetical protein [Saccharibacillus sp. JS10]MCQ4085348.1 hypothetical protein [Saccharibacillus sp. JS10]